MLHIRTFTVRFVCIQGLQARNCIGTCMNILMSIGTVVSTLWYLCINIETSIPTGVLFAHNQLHVHETQDNYQLYDV
jgi:cytochrome bd-type quinol oxidase subunit 1